MKNPWMSFWLRTAQSATNAWSGTARSLWTAEIGRHQRALLDDMTRRTSEFWTGALMAPVPVRPRKRH